MILRKMKMEDISQALVVAEAARAFQTANGNPTQWSGGYPQKELLESDVQRGVGYVFEGDDGIVHGFFAFILGDDPTYAHIEASEERDPHGKTEGRWLNNEPYGTIHRIATDGTIHGALEMALEYGFAHTQNIRIDTHADNAPMRHKCLKNGFTPCGVIYVADGSPRIAFQLKKY